MERGNYLPVSNDVPEEKQASQGDVRGQEQEKKTQGDITLGCSSILNDEQCKLRANQIMETVSIPACCTYEDMDVDHEDRACCKLACCRFINICCWMSNPFTQCLKEEPGCSVITLFIGQIIAVVIGGGLIMHWTMDWREAPYYYNRYLLDCAACLAPFLAVNLLHIIVNLVSCMSIKSIVKSICGEFRGLLGIVPLSMVGIAILGPLGFLFFTDGCVKNTKANFGPADHILTNEEEKSFKYSCSEFIVVFFSVVLGCLVIIGVILFIGLIHCLIEQLIVTIRVSLFVSDTVGTPKVETVASATADDAEEKSIEVSVTSEEKKEQVVKNSPV